MEEEVKGKMDIKKIIIIVAIVVFALLAIGGAATGIYFAVSKTRCEGFVYDRNGPTPMAGVVVSDGKTVVKTDDTGYYVLPGWTKERFITVTTPSGYWTEDYYIAIDKDRESYDFKLDKLLDESGTAVDQTDHNFLHLTDSEIGENGVGTWIDDVKETVAATNPAFIMHTGDICYEDGMKAHARDMNTDNMGVPVRYTIGNHDYVEYGKYGEALYEELFGPVWYSFDVGDIHYVVTPIGYGDEPNKYTLKETWSWLAKDLAMVEEGKKIVIFNHDYAPDENGFEVQYGSKTLDLREEGLLAWIFGHWHYSFVNNIDGIYNITTANTGGGGIDSSPAAIRSIYIKGTTLASSNLVYSYYDKGEMDTGATWTKQLSGQGLFSEPIIVGEVVYVATINESYPSKPAIYAMNAATGDEIWKYDVVNSVRNSMQYVDGKIIAQDIEGRVYAINATDGKQLWVNEDIALEYPRNTGMGVLVEGDSIYSGSAKKVTCLSLADGTVKWTETTSGSNSSPARMVISGETLIVPAHWNKIYAYNKTTGKPKWDFQHDDANFATTTPYVNGNLVIFALEDMIFELNADTGKMTRDKEHSDYNFDTATAPLISGGIGYYATVNKGIVAINMDTLEIKWNYKTGKSMIVTSPYTSGEISTVDSSIIEIGGKLYFGAADGYIYCVDKDGTLVDKFNLGTPVLSKLAIYNDDSIIVMDFEGRLSRIMLTEFAG